MYVVDVDEERWECVKHTLNLENIQFVKPENVEMIYLDSNVDAVIVATPTYTHTDLITGALKAGKAVFSEKPIAKTINDTVDCYKMAEKMESPLLCAFNRRFDPTFQDVFQRVRKGNV